MRILQLSPRFPYPPDDGGKIGIANITRQFAEQGNDVIFFTYNNSMIKDEHVKAFEKYCKVVLFPHSTKNSPFRIFKSLFQNQPLFITKHTNKKIEQFLLQIIKSIEFDVIHADHTSMAPLALFIKKITNKPAGLRLHNIEWLIWQRYADTLPNYHPKKWYIQRQAKLLKQYESEVLSKFNVCFAITNPDKVSALELNQKANVIVAAAGVNPEEWLPDPNISRNSSEMILATTYDWIHNIDGLKWFLNEVMPKVKEKNKQAALTLIGKNPPQWLNSYKRIGVTVLGYVESVPPFLNRAGIYIAPLFVGGGIRIKILEAMAMELPVVATSVSAEGIGANDDNGLIIRDDPVSFYDTINQLIENPIIARNLGINARNYVLENFSWKKNVGEMISIYKELS